MMLKRAIKVAVIAILIMSITNGLWAAQQNVRKVVRIGDETRKKNGVEYSLVAIVYDTIQLWRLTDSTGQVWLVNGKPLDDVRLPEDHFPDSLKRRLDVRMAWLPLPEKGELEIVCGILRLHGEQRDPGKERKALLDSGVELFSIGVKDIPTVKVKSLDDLPTLLGLPETTTQTTSTSAASTGQTTSTSSDTGPTPAGDSSSATGTPEPSSAAGGNSASAHSEQPGRSEDADATNKRETKGMWNWLWYVLGACVAVATGLFVWNHKTQKIKK